MISRGHLYLEAVASEVGSSTMPHKVNTIDLENASAQFEMTLGAISSMKRVLMTSRDQRDLSDSSALRYMGNVFGPILIGINGMLRTFKLIKINKSKIIRDIYDNPVILMEAYQTFAKTRGVKDSYERAKEFSRGKQNITLEDMHTGFIAKLPLSDEDKKYLMSLTPETYIGMVPEIVL